MVALVPRGVSQAYYIIQSRSLPDFVKCRKRAERTRPAQRISRYEIMWEREESLPDEIAKACESGEAKTNLGDIANTLQQVMNSLNRWSNEKFGSVSRELTKIRKRLEALSDQNRAANQLEVSALMKPMDEILYREEMMWLQRSRIPWLKEETAIQNSFIGRQLAGRRRIKSNF
jgi:hypothetical protein